MITNNANIVVNEVIQGFQNNRGRASCIIKDKDAIPEIIYNVVINFNKKHTEEKILIVCKDDKEVKSIHNSLRGFNPNYKTDNNIYVFPERLALTNIIASVKLIIIVGLDEDTSFLNKSCIYQNFILGIITNNMLDAYSLNYIRDVLPNIRVTVSHKDVQRRRISTPVEEECITCYLDEDDAELNTKYSDYISSCVVRFGTFENIAYSRSGNPRTNQSASEVRERIAYANGWSYNLNVNNSYDKAIDDAYNPNVLKDLADSFYNVSKKRRDLITDNKCKLNVIVNLVADNIDKRIAIVSMRGEFAVEVAKAINDAFGRTIALGFHDDLEPAYVRDENGEYIRYKSGDMKGECKLFKAKALQTLNLASFQAGEANVLCLKNSSPASLSCTFDIVIFTSSICLDIIEFKTRYNKVSINGVPNQTYRLYVKNTFEETKLAGMKKYLNVNQNMPDADLATYDEFTGDILL